MGRESYQFGRNHRQRSISLSTQSAISLQSLGFSYGESLVLENIDLEIPEKTLFALIGPNGGGKTTLLKLMVGLLHPTVGEVRIFGGIPEKNYSYIGYVPQNTNVNLDFPITALEVVLMGHVCGNRPLLGYGKHEVACAEGALQRVGMTGFANEKIGRLSGGQRQRVLIARALCADNTKILFLDEPTSSLDTNGQQQIYALLKELSESITIVVVSHDLAVMLDYASGIGYVNRTLTYHDAPAITRDSVIDSLGISDGHLCEVELLSYLGKRHA